SVTLERLTVEPLRRESIAGQDQAEHFVTATRQYPGDLALRTVVESLGDEVARESVPRHRALTRRCHPRRLLGEEFLDDRRIEVEVLDVLDALVLLGNRRRDGEPDLFVRQLDGQLEL